MGLKFTPVIALDNWSTKMVSFFLPPASCVFYRPEIEICHLWACFGGFFGHNFRSNKVFLKIGVLYVGPNALNIPWKFQLNPSSGSWDNCCQSFKIRQNSSGSVKYAIFSTCSYLDFYKRYGHQTYTNDRSWQKKKFCDVINIMTSHMTSFWRHYDVIFIMTSKMTS